VLFSVLTATFALIAWAAGDSGVWVIALCAGIIALWFATLAYGALRPRRRVS
jgi:hypothetical protein